MKKIIITNLFILSFLFSLQAQTLTNDNAQISLTENAIIAVSGSATNKGEMVNTKGIVAVSENWTNQKTYTTNEGQFLLNGLNIQTVNHNSQDFYHLIIDGGGEKQFLINANIASKIEFNDGLITPAAGVVLLLKDGAISENASEYSHVNGLIYNEGTGYKFFPIGKDGYFRPVSLENITGASPIVGFETFAPNPSSIAGRRISSVSTARYWQKYVLSGDYQGSTITLHYGEEEKIENIDSIVVVESDELGGAYRRIGRSNVDGDYYSGAITSDELAISTFFAIGVEYEVNLNDVYIPSALAPSAPDLEDRVIKIYGDVLLPDDFSFIIYNKWGQVIFQTNDLDQMVNNGWQGVNQKSSEDQMLGQYNYILKGKLLNGEIIEKAGSIVLVR